MEAAVQYGLLTPETYEITDLAEELRRLADQERADRFARHILLHLGGLRVVEAIQQMQADDLNVTGDSLARFLTSQGFRVTEHNTAINSLRLWLAEAGLFPKARNRAWEVNQAEKERLLGLDDDQIMTLAGLSEAQAAFVEGICVLQPEGWTPATDPRDWAEATRGVRFGRQSLPKAVLETLQAAGLIEYRTRGTGGGKTSEFRITSRFDQRVLQPFVEIAIRDLDASVSAYYKKRPEDIFNGLDSKDKHIKGQSLEAFAIYLMRLLGLRFVAWRKREAAEVDALLEGILGPIPTRWQVQCKNTPTAPVRLEDVSKEVGLLPVTQATHILFVANSRFTSDALRFARAVVTAQPVALYLLDRDDFQTLREHPAQIGNILRRKAEEILRYDRPIMFPEN